MIPKVVHRVWLGSPVPDRFDAAWASWQRLLPDHEFRTWNEQAIRALGVPRYFDGALTYPEQADIARLRIVNRLGGIYTDCDVELLHPLTPLWAERDRLVVFEEPGPEWRGDRVWNGCFAASPGALSFIERFIEHRAAGFPRAAPPNERTGPEGFTLAVEFERLRAARGVRVYPPSFLDLTGAESTAVLRTRFVEGGSWTPVPNPPIGPNGRRAPMVAVRTAALRAKRRAMSAS